jgi:acetyl esterase/lipase
MKFFSQELSGGGFDCRLECYISDENARDDGKANVRDAVLIFPGGGYYMVSKREGEPVALAFLPRGFNAFVLYYSTKAYEPKSAFPAQLLQGIAALKYIRDNAEKLCVNKAGISVCGFSAGGNLAAAVACMCGSGYVTDVFGKDEIYRPYRQILCYPVITPHGNSDTFKNLAGDDEKLREFLTLDKRVDKDTPPAFLWHTSDDSVVDCRDSLKFAAALRENGVPYELHVFPRGFHGLSLATSDTGPVGYPAVARWIDYAADFLKTVL